MGVRAYKDNQGRTRYRVTFSRNGRRLVDERLPAGTSREKADHYYARISGEWFDRNRLGIQEIPLISTVIREYERRIIPGLKSPSFAYDCIRTIAPHAVGKTMAQLQECVDAMIPTINGGRTTIVHRVRFARTLARYAVRWKLAAQDYGLGIETGPLHNERHFYPKRQEVAKILRHMNKEMRWACWQLYYSGLRRGELWTALIVDDCYMNADTKNGEPKMTPISIPLRKIAGTPKMTKDALSKRFKLSAIKAGYGHYRLHDLRHGTASMILAAGGDLPMIADVLGHRNLKSTRRYAHRMTEAKRTMLNFAATGGKIFAKQGTSSGMPPVTGKKKAA